MSLEIVNRKATYLYFFEQTFEAGILLTGTEIKSIRAGQANLSDAYCGHTIFIFQNIKKGIYKTTIQKDRGNCYCTARN